MRKSIKRPYTVRLIQLETDFVKSVLKDSEEKNFSTWLRKVIREKYLQLQEVDV